MRGGFRSSFFKKKVKEEEPSNLGLARVIKYDVLKKATNSFCTEIGSGAFGRVYHGKILYDRNPKRLQQFFNEVTVLSRLRHKNLVTLYGCTNPRGQELLLVYDYVPNGTVADHLHGQQSTLSWTIRMQIALETAEALAYLHARETPVIHRDVKTPNILLDHAFHVKLADLGMCHLMPNEATHVSTVPQGTMGYRDPEYDRYFWISDKTDVYSFGVVLIELISGQQAVDVNRDSENIYLDAMARNKILNKKLKELVDPNLEYHYNNDVRRMIDSVARLANECLQPKGEFRPSMVQVVTILKEIQNDVQQLGLNEVDELNDGSLNKASRQAQHTFRIHSQRWRTWASFFIQAAWRRYCKRKAAERRRREEAADFVEDNLSSGPSSLAATFYALMFVSKVLLRVRRFRANNKAAKDLLKLVKPHVPYFTEDDCTAIQFRRLHNREAQHTFRFHSQEWRTWAANFIQAAWQRYSRRKAAERRRREEAADFVEDHLSSGPSRLVATCYALMFVSKVLLRVRRSRANNKAAMDLLKLLKPQVPDFTEDDAA